MKTEDTEVLRR